MSAVFKKVETFARELRVPEFIRILIGQVCAYLEGAFPQISMIPRGCQILVDTISG